jgi:hypothetical protein
MPNTDYRDIQLFVVNPLSGFMCLIFQNRLDLTAISS